MKILIFNAYYEPEIAASLYLCVNLYEDLANNGFELDLFVPIPTRGVSIETRNEYKKKRYEIKCNGKLKIHRIFIPGESQNTLLRTMRYLLMNIIFFYIGLRTETNLIFLDSTPPTQGAMGALLKRIKKVPVVYDLQDIFPDSLVNTGLTHEGSFLFKIGTMIENFTYKNVNKILVISEDFKINIIAKGVPEEKMEIVYNWVDENEVVPLPKDENILFERFNLPKDKFYISYCGNIGLTQNMDMLVEAAEELESNPNIMFLIVGDGAYKPELEKQINDKELKNIILLPFQPYEDIAHVFSLADVGLVISKANIGNNSVPSKTWSIMSAGRAVLASFDIGSELNRIIERSQCGVCVEPDNKDAFKKAVLWLYENKEARIQMGDNGRKFIMNNLTRKAGTSKKINIIEKVIYEQR